MIKTNVEELNAVKARQWLEHNKGNRPIRQSVVDSLANEMLEGRWICDGDPIRFDINGNQLNGQHRCHAVVLADKVRLGISVPVLVVRGLDPRAMMSMDTNLKRTSGDVLFWAGEKNTKNLAAAAQYYHRHLTHTESRYHGVKATQVIGILDENPGLRDSIDLVHNVVVVPKALLAAYHYIFAQKDECLANDLVHGMAHGFTDLSRPFAVLRERFIRDPFRVLGPHKTIVLLCKAWNFERRGKRVSKFQIAVEPEIPAIV
jgi:hypothetical protein